MATTVVRLARRKATAHTWRMRRGARKTTGKRMAKRIASAGKRMANARVRWQSHGKCMTKHIANASKTHGKRIAHAGKRMANARGRITNAGETHGKRIAHARRRMANTGKRRANARQNHGKLKADAR